MAKMNCRCGEVLSNSMAPNDVQLRVYSDKEWDDILSVDTINTWEFPAPEHDVWRCPKCEHIYVFGKGNNKVIKEYALVIE